MNDGFVTYLLIGITAITSFSAFSRSDMVEKMILNPYTIHRKKEWWRLLSHGLLHGDIGHLLFNMITLFFFGRQVESIFYELFGNTWMYPLFYISALAFSSIPAYAKYKNNPSYNALGASGAVSAVLFAAILFNPWQTLLIKFIIPVPAILFAVGYLIYSSYMSKKGNDNIGHDAHLYGALYGIVFPIVLKPFLISLFLNALKNPTFNF